MSCPLDPKSPATKIPRLTLTRPVHPLSIFPVKPFSRACSAFLALFSAACAASVFAPLAAAEALVSVTQITQGPNHHYFGYIGQSRTIPWSADGRYILALQVPFQDRMPGPDDPADVCLIDTRSNYALRVVDQSRGYNPQQGTMFYWNPAQPETQFFFQQTAKFQVF